MPDHDPNSDVATISDLMHRTVVDRNGDKIGTVEDVYLDDARGEPAWLAVSTGWFGTKTSFVPVAGATWVGDDLQVPHGQDAVKDAPRIDPGEQLSTDEERELYHHYGRGDDWTQVREDWAGAAPEPDRGGDASMTRAEEEVEVRRRTEETGRARLKKWVETENVQFTVPIRREKARLVVESAEGERVDASELGTDDQEVVLSEEVIDIDKRVVAKERVRLETDVVEDEVVVDEQVRKERIGVEGDVDDRR